ncbi:MAG: hypothetical protein M1823_001409 [Watsoniomyces obsoletus]|nr:MAG: hypothetical protein M1823_001409 [Watsoniomyces obsoletus]
MSMNRVPGEDALFISGSFSLSRTAVLKKANITHIVSTLRATPNEALLAPYQHLTVEIDDMEDEDFLQHFPVTNRFIQQGLDDGGGVLVHCAIGKSRSATCVMAFLMHRYRLTPGDALARIRQSRPMCEPNSGFMQQLELYHRMRCPDSVEDQQLYQRWRYERELKRGLTMGQAPESIRFADTIEGGNVDTPVQMELRCRQCRHKLATDQHVVPHAQSSTPTCSHYFLEPLSWMRAELERGELSGRLVCPTCKASLGRYAWQGLQCSCRRWIVPGISVVRSKVDEIVSRPVGPQQLGIRLPPSLPTFQSPEDQLPPE